MLKYQDIKNGKDNSQHNASFLFRFQTLIMFYNHMYSNIAKTSMIDCRKVFCSLVYPYLTRNELQAPEAILHGPFKQRNHIAETNIHKQNFKIVEQLYICMIYINLKVRKKFNGFHITKCASCQFSTIEMVWGGDRKNCLTTSLGYLVSDNSSFP